MSHTLIIKRTGIYAKSWVYDEEKKEGSYVVVPIKPDAILQELHSSVEVEEGFTLRDYFKLILKYQMLILLDPFFPSFLTEYKRCPKKGCYEDDMPSLVLQNTVSVELKGGKVDGIENYFRFNGSRTDPKEPTWAIEFTPLHKLLDTPLKIEKTSVYITRFRGYKVVSNQEYINPETEFISLFSFVTEPIWELSFCGEPQERNNKKKEIDLSVEEIENGTAKLIPWKEVKKSLTKKKGGTTVVKEVKKGPVKKAEPVKTPVKKTTTKKK